MKHANAAIFVPHNGCPYRCSFCNQKNISGAQRQPTAEDVEQTARTALESGCGGEQAELAFFGGSFTSIEPGYMRSLLEAAAPFLGKEKFAGIRISTRPDAVDEVRLSVLKKYGVTSIEIGAQSMADEVLRLNNRGHLAADIKRAAKLIREAGFSLGVQMMTGLYGDTPAGAMQSALGLVALKPDTVRIYPTVVMKGTRLAELYEAGEYTPPKLDDAVRLCAALIGLFQEHHIRVIRVGLHSEKELFEGMLAGPYHPAFGELCLSRLFLYRLQKEFLFHHVPKGRATVFIHPRDLSKAQGQKKCNLEAMREEGYEVDFSRLDSVPTGSFRFYDPQKEKNVTCAFMVTGSI